MFGRIAVSLMVAGLAMFVTVALAAPPQGDGGKGGPPQGEGQGKRGPGGMKGDGQGKGGPGGMKGDGQGKGGFPGKGGPKGPPPMEQQNN